MLKEKGVVRSATEWQQRITELKQLLEKLERELVEAEADLTEQLTAVNAFEFKLRAALRPLIQRLDKLTTEIDQLRGQLRQHQEIFDDFRAEDSHYQEMGDAFHEERGDYGAYRYHEPLPEQPGPALDEQQRQQLKRLYRQLARRFHPDMGQSGADRAYRTQMMMAINAAYAAGDLARLLALAEEPEMGEITAVDQNEQQVHYLLRELERLQRRLAEIKEELALVQSKKNYRLMEQAHQAEAAGRDWLTEVKERLQEEVSHKMVERDVLQQELEMTAVASAEESGFQGEAFASAIWDISLEHAYDTDPDIEAEYWLSRYQNENFQEDPNPDDF